MSTVIADLTPAMKLLQEICQLLKNPGASISASQELSDFKSKSVPLTRILKQLKPFASVDGDQLTSLSSLLLEYLELVSQAADQPEIWMSAYRTFLTTIDGVKEAVSEWPSEIKPLLLDECEKSREKISLALEEHVPLITDDSLFKLTDNLRSEMRSEHTLILGAMTFYVASTAVIGNILAKDVVLFKDLRFIGWAAWIVGSIFWLTAGVLTVGATWMLLLLYKQRSGISRDLILLALSPNVVDKKDRTTTVLYDLYGYAIDLQKVARLAMFSLPIAAFGAVLIGIAIWWQKLLDNKNILLVMERNSLYFVGVVTFLLLAMIILRAMGKRNGER